MSVNVPVFDRPLILGHMPRMWPILDGDGTWYLADSFDYFSPLLGLSITIPAGEYMNYRWDLQEVRLPLRHI